LIHKPESQKVFQKPARYSHKVASSGSTSTGIVLKSSVPSYGTTKSQEFYQKAALAVTEGRSNDARHFFKQAIDAGAETQVYEAFFKMLVNEKFYDEARNVIQQGMKKYPVSSNLYTMFGHMERKKLKNYSRAEEIFREGLKHVPSNVQLEKGLAQTLVQIGTEESLKEAGNIFAKLERKDKLYSNDGIYQRYKAFQRNPRANKVYEFFKDCGMKPGITGFSNIPKNVADIVVEFNNEQFSESFGISGPVLIRCFRYNPNQTDLVQLQEYLRSFGPRDFLGLQDGGKRIINKSLAFIAVANSNLIRDHVMSILSEHGEAIVPLDDAQLKQLDSQVQILREVLGQYLGMRDLYSQTFPVSMRRFFGREKLLIQLTDEIHSGQFFGIYGLRKIGKTSLLYQLIDEKLREEAVAYVDLQSSNLLSLGTCSPLYWELERNLYLRLHKRKQQEAASMLRLGKLEHFSELSEQKAKQCRLIFSEDMRSILDALAENRISSFKRVVIVLDELEHILPIGGQAGVEGYIDFFGLLRGLAQTERYRGLLSSIVVAANSSISEKGYWEGRENPVFALYKPVFLPPFTIEECNEMIVTLGKNMSVYWTEDALATIFAETGGHPFLTRIFCSRIVKQYDTRPLTITGEMVKEQVIPFIRTENDKLQQITELLRTHFPQEEDYLNQIALDEVTKSLPDEAMRHLLGYNLIKSDRTHYQITINLLKRWLKRRAGVRD
ncbi:MAG TPA: ATP-binding protein, partial [Thermodesulfovibrionia bacterium]|nr:ATP-binding protein [Thermodesulfovibrionia bacterium]